MKLLACDNVPYEEWTYYHKKQHDLMYQITVKSIVDHDSQNYDVFGTFGQKVIKKYGLIKFARNYQS